VEWGRELAFPSFACIVSVETGKGVGKFPPSLVPSARRKKGESERRHSENPAWREGNKEASKGARKVRLVCQEIQRSESFFPFRDLDVLKTRRRG